MIKCVKLSINMSVKLGVRVVLIHKAFSNDKLASHILILIKMLYKNIYYII